MVNPRILFWYRKDLRIKDNRTLIKASSLSKSLTAIYILDENYTYDFDAQSRSWFLANSLKELSLNWQKAGSRLIIDKGNPEVIIPQIAKLIEAKYVVWNKSIEPYEINRDKRIEDNLFNSNISFFNLWDNLLLNPKKIFSSVHKPYTVYGPFLKNIKSKLNKYDFNKECNESLIINDLKDLKDEIKNNQKIKSSNKKLEDFIKNNDFSGKNICPCQPGEIAAEKLLNNFTSTDKIITYDTNRNFPSQNSTSFLSASLRFGTISIRRLWKKTIELNLLKTDSNHLLSIETWQKELIWREFYQHCLFHFPELEKGPYRKKWDIFPWENNHEWVKRWSDGNTGFPIIDASMRQLNQSGWMHNRCRMIVASFLVKDLICDWQMGEEIFMKSLVDGDIAANNGGWQWSASSGMDPKPLRIFNPYTQTNKFDPFCKYIKYWIPELSNAKNSEIISGELLEKYNYPKAIVNHHSQQRYFKKLYSEI